MNSGALFIQLTCHSFALKQQQHFAKLDINKWKREQASLERRKARRVPPFFFPPLLPTIVSSYNFSNSSPAKPVFFLSSFALFKTYRTVLVERLAKKRREKLTSSQLKRTFFSLALFFSTQHATSLPPRRRCSHGGLAAGRARPPPRRLGPRRLGSPLAQPRSCRPGSPLLDDGQQQQQQQCRCVCYCCLCYCCSC